MGHPVILCIDDDVGILRSLERCLIMGKYNVLKATSGEEGLRLLAERDGKVDLLIVDQRMPRMTGNEFLCSVKDRFGCIPSIMLSGYADSGSLVRAVNECAIFRFLAKPWDNQELMGTIKDAIRAGANPRS